MQQFCALSWSAFAWYFVSLISCLIVIKGLEHFMICSAANYAHISSGLKYLELREVISDLYVNRNVFNTIITVINIIYYYY